LTTAPGAVPGLNHLGTNVFFIPTKTGWINERYVVRIEHGQDGELLLLGVDGELLAVTEINMFSPELHND
jgi:hypothetical protein